MTASAQFEADGKFAADLEVLWEDSERRFCKGWRAGTDGERRPWLAVIPGSPERDSPLVHRLAHEYGLRDRLDNAWALRPVKLVTNEGQPLLVCEYQEAEPLERLLVSSLDLGRFLRLGVAIARSLASLHGSGLVHRDIKPANILVGAKDEHVWFTGFGIASQLLRERQAAEPPERITGTLSHMAPEQTGRMNRSVDSRSDLYSLGVTLYQVLTGRLPFAASDALEWVHCHIARMPAPPHTLVAGVPKQVSAIVMRLLAKTPEERYQTAEGVERDLRHCLRAWESGNIIEEFPLGERDRFERLVLPERLYGRGSEVAALVAAFDRVVEQRSCGLTLVRGGAGIGKSSVVNELHKALVGSRGRFASGKFDQLKSDVPYAPVSQALQGLVGSLLAGSEAARTGWADSMRTALDIDVPLAVELVPELGLILGEPQAIPEMDPGVAKLRWQRALRRLLGVFARPEHPLALFLDDLQWLDGATLDLLETMLLDPDLQGLFVVGAYRDNEVDPEHPLTRKVATIRAAGTAVEEITLGPLTPDDLAAYVSDCFSCGHAEAVPLAQVVHDKTAGNPLFASQFVQTLVDEGLITFDVREAQWSWDLPSIRSKTLGEGVVDMVRHKLSQLPGPTQRALEELACLGHRAGTATLAIVHQADEAALDADMWDALRRELVVRTADGYRFVHDRVQEAAYSLMPEASRTRAHLRAGRALSAGLTHEQRDEALFDIVGQLNRGASLIDIHDERMELVELNLAAARRAMSTAAHASARAYLEFAAGLVAENVWQQHPDRRFELEFRRGECEFHTGDVARSSARLEALMARAASLSDRATVACLLATVNWGAQRPDQGLKACTACLEEAGLDVPLAPTDTQVRAAFERLHGRLRDRPIESLLQLPTMTDPASLQTMELVAKVLPCALAVNFNLAAMLACAGVELSLDHGNCDASCYVYEYLGLAESIICGDFDRGYRFGRLGVDVADSGLRRFHPTVAAFFAAVIAPWSKHAAICRTLIRDSIVVAQRECDLITFVGTAATEFVVLMVNGDPLAEVEASCDRAVHITRRAGFPDYIQAAKTHAALTRCLRGRTPRFGWLDDAHCSEAEIERYFVEDPHVPIYECWYWVCKSQARYFAGEIPEALEAVKKAQALAWMCGTLLQSVELAFYGALVHAAAWERGSTEERAAHAQEMRIFHGQLEARAKHCPENFGCRAALVAAEIARVEAHDDEAEQMYELAGRLAHESGFKHVEALVNELAAQFHGARGDRERERDHLRAARRGYQQWGAEGKVRQLEARQGEPTEVPREVDAGRTVQTSVEQLDLSVVLKVLEAVSGETDLDRLVTTVVRLALEQAGASRGLLLLPFGDAHHVEAEAYASEDGFAVTLRHDVASSDELPRSILQQVLRTKERVLLNDASEDHLFAADAYLLAHKARSILCMPLLKQARLVGVLYLENPHVAHTFTPSRLALLKLLASEAAISLENARLYHDLQERESRMRRLVDANIIGIVLWHRDGRILEANDAFLRMVGHERQDLVSGRVRWGDLSPPDWIREDMRVMETVRVLGAVQAFEREVLRKDGMRVPVLMGAASFEGTADEGVGYFLDLSESKRAEQVARDSERRNHELQMRLADANRIASIGQLAAAIAHEINQPLAGIITNASTGTRMLAVDPVDVRALGETIRRTLRDAERASEVIRRLRSLFTGHSLVAERVDLNEIAESVTAMLALDFRRDAIDLELQLEHGLPCVRGDQVQLQQVILNMLRNAAQATQDVDDRPRKVLLRTRSEVEGRVELSVTDTGGGLDPASKGKLFEAFYTTKPDGMGIGLSVSRSIVERHEGRLWAEANAGPGATFAFSLPAAS